MLCNRNILRGWLCLIHCTALHFKIVISAWEAGCCTSSATTVTVKDSVWRPCAVPLHYCHCTIVEDCVSYIAVHYWHHCYSWRRCVETVRSALQCSAIALLTLHYCNSWRPCVRNCCRKGGKGHNHSSYLTKMKMILMNRKIQNISFCSVKCRVAKGQWRKQFRAVHSVCKEVVQKQCKGVMHCGASFHPNGLLPS